MATVFGVLAAVQMFVIVYLIRRLNEARARLDLIEVATAMMADVERKL